MSLFNLKNEPPSIHLIKQSTLQFQKDCGIFFKNYRINRKKSEEEVAEYLEVSIEQLKKYESGIEGFPLVDIYCLSNILDIRQDEIIKLHQDLESKHFPNIKFDANLIAVPKASDILRSARITLCLRQPEVLESLKGKGHKITEKTLYDIEDGLLELNLELWTNLCVILHLGFDSYRGYSEAQHLSNVSKAFDDGKLQFKPSQELLEKLVNHHTTRYVNYMKSVYLTKHSLAWTTINVDD
ncbi:MAG: helix-turn-helix transcriptional regulator [Xanthomonadaceae bacterium]|nr:helix-turn-helix transcriptional regulator [Xanthomonadaceae bacterium]